MTDFCLTCLKKKCRTQASKRNKLNKPLYITAQILLLFSGIQR